MDYGFVFEGFNLYGDISVSYSMWHSDVDNIKFITLAMYERLVFDVNNIIS